ncbi:hypothetical protein PISMIDRAFT_214506 [Pisolithus microcarpus 441]|uniref:Uncharacterized protein n=1 Tax=Pisolithus microcarpus 441 TaxID=765257 RepID=A0A0C9XYP0_9AGAM|nr:hypothetical protein PISMIDRAFT_214506 [Pisolithus microcarpus 441]
MRCVPNDQCAYVCKPARSNQTTDRLDRINQNPTRGSHDIPKFPIPRLPLPKNGSDPEQTKPVVHRKSKSGPSRCPLLYVWSSRALKSPANAGVGMRLLPCRGTLSSHIAKPFSLGIGLDCQLPSYPCGMVRDAPCPTEWVD